ncbi:unnamed protein product [Toxocara canis]|uniref:Aspartic protease 6 n=1 Tax=Toxocara canis TaxID=6265 RepID=A0A183TV25_TOXCA|nr:unnamed protein product [Toxocara canis]
MDKVTVLLIFLGTVIGATLAIFRMPVRKIESERNRRIRLGLTPKPRAFSFDSRRYASIVTDYSDIEYIGTVYMGSQRAPLRFVLDTGSADFWAPDISCGICDYYCHGLPASFCHKLCDKGCCSIENHFTESKCYNKRTFNGAKSTTYRQYDGTWRIKYGAGMAAGFRGLDKIDLGGMNFDVVFGQATILDTVIASNKNFDGILGLAFQSISVDNTLPPFLAAVEQKVINESIFTVFLRKAGQPVLANGGVYTFGAFDNVNCEGEINYVHLSSATYFQFVLQKFSFGPTQMGSTHVQVISDTGTSFIGAPADVFTMIIKAIGATKDPYGVVVPCNHGEFPNMTLTINGHDYTLTSHHYITNTNRCELAMFSMNSIGLGPAWILGDPFIRAYCNVHDMKNQRIGFARSKEYTP